MNDQRRFLPARAGVRARTPHLSPHGRAPRPSHPSGASRPPPRSPGRTRRPPTIPDPQRDPGGARPVRADRADAPVARRKGRRVPDPEVRASSPRGSAGPSGGGAAASSASAPARSAPCARCSASTAAGACAARRCSPPPTPRSRGAAGCDERTVQKHLALLRARGLVLVEYGPHNRRRPEEPEAGPDDPAGIDLRPALVAAGELRALLDRLEKGAPDGGGRAAAGAARPAARPHRPHRPGRAGRAGAGGAGGAPADAAPGAAAAQPPGRRPGRARGAPTPAWGSCGPRSRRSRPRREPTAVENGVEDAVGKA